MPHAESIQDDIAEWVKSILPPDLWNRYCHLSFTQMARVPDLAKYAEEIRKADRSWYRERRKVKVIY